MTELKRRLSHITYTWREGKQTVGADKKYLDIDGVGAELCKLQHDVFCPAEDLPWEARLQDHLDAAYRRVMGSCMLSIYQVI